MIGTSLISILISAITGRTSAKINVQIHNEIQADVYDKIIGTDWESLSEYRSGDLINRLNSDASNVSSNVVTWLPNLITRTVQLGGAVGIILFYDPTMALIALLSAPVTIIVSRVLMRSMRLYNRKMKEISSEIMSFQEDSFHNIQSIKAFDLMGFFSTNMRKIQNRYKTTSLDYNKFSIFASSFMSAVGSVVSFVSFAWAAYRLWDGSIEFGTFTLFLQLSSVISTAFSGIISLAPSAITATTSAGRIMAVTELTREKVIDKDTAEKLKHTALKNGVSVHLENVSFCYKDGISVLKSADIFAHPSEIIALVGPSGEGKTTVIRILLGLIFPQEGKAFVADGKYRSEISAATRGLFSYVPQGNTMFAGTIAENLRMVKNDATDDELVEALKTACAYDFVKKMPDGINSVIGERGVGLSEGQAQRISIARAILRDAPILLLDEATSALDVATEREVLKNIMKSDSKKTCIVTTHRPSVLSICDRVYRITGSTSELLDEQEAQKMVMDF